jgi:hypothetical protein
MAEPPPDPPRAPDDDDDDDVVEQPATLTTEPPTDGSALGAPKDRAELAETARDGDEPVIFRARATRAQIVANVVVGVALSAMVSAFLFSITFDKPWLGAVAGVALALFGARNRKEKDELTPITIVPAATRKRAVELHFEGGPSVLIDSASAKHVDAEATGESREGYTHWIVFRRTNASDFRVRARSRAQAVSVCKQLRVLLEVPPLHALGDDELGGEDYPKVEPPPEEPAAKKRRARRESTDAVATPAEEPSAAPTAPSADDGAKPGEPTAS